MAPAPLNIIVSGNASAVNATANCTYPVIHTNHTTTSPCVPPPPASHLLVPAWVISALYYAWGICFVCWLTWIITLEVQYGVLNKEQRQKIKDWFILRGWTLDDMRFRLGEWLIRIGFLDVLKEGMIWDVRDWVWDCLTGDRG